LVDCFAIGVADRKSGSYLV